MSATKPVPNRVCPHCSTIAATADAHCPWCGRSYRRRSLPGIAALLALAVLVTLAGVGAMLLTFAGELDRRLDDAVATVQDDLDRDVRRIERTLTQALEERLPAVPVP